MPAFISRLTLIFIFLLPCSQNGHAAIGNSLPKSEVITSFHFSKKEKKGSRFWKKLKSKFTKGKNKERRKNHFGRLGLFILLGAVISLFIADTLFLLGLLGGIVFGVIGLIEDENITAASFAIGLPIAFILVVMAAVAANWDD